MNDDEHLLTDSRKELKQQKKIARRTDRSQFKKSDAEKLLRAQEQKRKEPIGLKGRVISILGLQIIVDSLGSLVTCTLKGVFKKEVSRKKNLIAVGDIVIYSPSSPKEGVITYVFDRYSVLSRADNLNQKKEQLIAVNIDQVLITTACIEPSFKPILIDRYLIATRKGNMSALILINKADLLTSSHVDAAKERLLIEDFVNTYRQLGFQVLLLSCKTKEGIEELKGYMQGKASVFSGQSGVGKSSLINEVANLDLPVGEVVRSTSKGSHVTTKAQLIPLKQGGWCIDTPGIKSFGIWDLNEQDIKEHYFDIAQLAASCHFLDCSHTHEPNCCVLDALEKKSLSALRYGCYRSLLEEVQSSHRRR